MTDGREELKSEYRMGSNFGLEVGSDLQTERIKGTGWGCPRDGLGSYWKGRKGGLYVK